MIPKLRRHTSDRDNPTIFVSIASYRDSVCNSTVESLYSQARHPDRVYVGICQQNNSIEDKDCLVSFKSSTESKSINLNTSYSTRLDNIVKKNVRIIRIPHTEAKGPTYARYLCSTLWRGEDYYFQMDSHMRCVKDWDVKCIDTIREIKQNNLSQNPIISHYPPEIETYANRDKDRFNVPRMCKAFFNNRGMISFMGAETIDTKGVPYRTPYIAAGMMFCESKFLKDVPFDPTLEYLFVGEEILQSVRLFTSGYDIFTPTENIVYHEYIRSNKPKIWTDNPYYSDSIAFKKVLEYLSLNSEKNSESRFIYPTLKCSMTNLSKNKKNEIKGSSINRSGVNGSKATGSKENFVNKDLNEFIKDDKKEDIKVVPFTLPFIDDDLLENDTRYTLSSSTSSIDKYGLGTVRTLRDYYMFAGIDPNTKHVYKNFCREGNVATEKEIEESNKIEKTTVSSMLMNFGKEGSFKNKYVYISILILVCILGLLKLIY